MRPAIQQLLDLAWQHYRTGRFEEAGRIYQQILTQEPRNSTALNLLGVVAHRMGKLDIALDLIQQSIAITPSCPESQVDLGNVLQAKGLFDEAIAAYGCAVALRPDFAEAYVNLATAQKEKGDIDQAIASYSRAIALKPDSPVAHYNRSLALLARGDFQQGWQGYEWRLKCADIVPARQRPAAQWDGSSPRGRTLLLHAEQGFGDTIQMARYIPLIVARGARVLLDCPAELSRLLRFKGVEPAAGAAFDVHCPMGSLPLMFDTRVETIPQGIPYLAADAALASAWGARMAGGFRIGLAWRGSRANANDANRSISLAQLAPLTSAPAVFYSLQKGAGGAQAVNPPTGMHLVDFTADLHDFADTAALIAHLDLVITVDTAVAHLAGALGKPVWILLPFVPDWRWMFEREDTPWYPTARLFRQTTRGDWSGVVDRVAAALHSTCSRV